MVCLHLVVYRSELISLTLSDVLMLVGVQSCHMLFRGCCIKAVC